MAHYAISTFNPDEAQHQGQLMDEDHPHFRLVDSRYPIHLQIEYHSMLANIMPPQRQAIFYQDEESPQQDSNNTVPQAGPLLGSREDIGYRAITHQTSHQSSNTNQENVERHNSNLYKRDGQLQINKSQTKNYLSFIWKKIVRFLKSQQTVCQSDWWNKLKNKRPSLQVFSQLFAEEGARHHLRRFFQGKSIYRLIMLSSIDAHKKKVYIRHFQSIYRGFLRKKIEYLK